MDAVIEVQNQLLRYSSAQLIRNGGKTPTIAFEAAFVPRERLSRSAMKHGPRRTRGRPAAPTCLDVNALEGQLSELNRKNVLILSTWAHQDLH